MKNIKNWKGLFYGIAYGLVSRAIFALEDFPNAIVPTFGLMTVSFMFIVPFVVGLITAYHQDTITSSRKIAMITMPVFAIIGLVGISLLDGQEGNNLCFNGFACLSNHGFTWWGNWYKYF